MHGTETELIERLAHHRTLGSAPREELAWLVERASLRKLNKDEILSHKGEPVDAMYVILAGRLGLFVDRGAGPHRMVEWREGDVTGMLPYSRLVKPPGNSIAQEPLEILSLHRDHLREMTRECFEITSILVHLMLDRARLFTSSDLMNEKMISLGKLSAGLAHELNNPASAIERSVCLLSDRLEDSEDAMLALGAARLSEAEIAAVERIREGCLAKQSSGTRSPLEQADREDAIADWLATHGLDTRNAQMLADTEATFDALNALAEAVPRAALNNVVRWAASGCAVRNLASEIRGAAMRISSLIMAVKGFTYMDQALAADRVDPSDGLRNAVTVLNAKATQKSVAVTMKLAERLPQVFGFAAELNQVWGNLIDNALDAAPIGGHVEVRANQEGEHVVVHIIDDGPGIPAEARSRIFDPFFTTKPMGQGTGLGLDIARRLVSHNHGVIDFDSQPGRTEFRVSLPIAS
jgi:signal transduction histidine kinase